LNKLLPLLVFSVLLLIPAGAQNAFAQSLPSVTGDCTSNNTGGGDWSDPNTWDCDASDVPAKRKQVVILFGDTVTVDTNLNRSSGESTTFIGNVFVFGTLVVPSPFTFKSDFLQIFSGFDSATVENFGNMIIAEFLNFDNFNNNCGSTLTIQRLSTNTGGDRGPEGFNRGLFTNFGTFELGILFGPNDLFDNFSPFQNGGSLINVIESGIAQNFGGSVPITTISNICIVGGELLSIDSTALLLAGLQSSAIWMLPVLAGAAGVGAFYIKTRMNKE